MTDYVLKETGRGGLIYQMLYFKTDNCNVSKGCHKNKSALNINFQGLVEEKQEKTQRKTLIRGWGNVQEKRGATSVSD